MKQLAIILGLAAAWQISNAELGGAPAPANDQSQLQTFQNYKVLSHSFNDDSQYKEYLDGSNLVFAVFWDGTSRPDMSKLLGKYFFEFQSLNANAPHLNGATQLESSNLVIQSQGRMRSFSGLAYLPTRLPVNFSPSEIGR
ncbi:MAG: hypothetical protein RLY90_1453 [Pseudomonadota bacterium]|jgi:hypothetical protein